MHSTFLSIAHHDSFSYLRMELEGQLIIDHVAQILITLQTCFIAVETDFNIIQQSESHLYTGYILDIGSRLLLLEIHFLRTIVRSMASIRWRCKCDRHRWTSESSWQSRLSEFRPNSDTFTLQILERLRKIFSLQLCILYKGSWRANRQVLFIY